MPDYELKEHLVQKFGYESSIDFEYLLEVLKSDYQLIEKLGETWFRLTAKGEKVARKGFSRYKQVSSLKEQIDVAGKLIAIAVGVSTIIGVIIGYLMK